MKQYGNVCFLSKEYKSVYEHMNKEGRQELTDSAGRALGSVLYKVKASKDLGCRYTQLYQYCVCDVSDYASGVYIEM